MLRKNNETNNSIYISNVSGVYRMTDIHNRILAAAVQYEAQTGGKPNSVYLGESEISDLIFSMAEDTSIADLINAKLTGENRPEIDGMNVYAVNAMSHLACGVAIKR